MTQNSDPFDFADIWLAAIEGSGTGIWDRDVSSGMIRYSRGWWAILGYKDAPASCPIEASYQRVHPDDLAGVQATIQDHFDQKTERYEVEHRLRCADGSYKWVLSRGSVTSRDADGRALRMVGTTTDVTSLRRLTEELRHQKAEAQAKTERLGELSAKLAEQTGEIAAIHRLAKVGSWQWDLARRCLWFRPETWLLLGCRPQDRPISYDELKTIVHPDDYDRAMSLFYRSVQDKTAITTHYRVVSPGGSVYDVLTHAEPIIEADGRVLKVRGTTQDITPYRQIEQALRESEDHHRHMVELHPGIPWTAAPDGSILEIGPQWTALTGVAKEDALPFGWINYVHSDDRERVSATWQHALAMGDPVDSDFRIRLANGTYGWFRTRAAPHRNTAGTITRWYGTLDDVTDRHAAEDARRNSEALAFRVLEATHDAVIVFGRNGLARFGNSKACAYVGVQEELVGQTVARLFPGSHGRRLARGFNLALSTTKPVHFEMFWPPTDRWLEVDLYTSDDDLSLFMRDITDRKIAQDQLRYAAHYDSLTGVINRGTFFTQLADALETSVDGHYIALFCIDLDYFKEINESFGHSAGDELLKAVANRLKSCLREHDILGRAGGDEFMIMQTGVRKPADAVALASRISGAMEKRLNVGDLSLRGSVSMGIALSVPDDIDAGKLYHQADLALCEAKAHTPGRYRLFHPDMEVESDRRRQMKLDLAVALAQQQFHLVFQPIVRVADRRIVGVEALLRWRHPRHGPVGPSEFIPIAEETGLISELGAWVLRQACASATHWPDDIRISVNVSPRQFELGNVSLIVAAALQSSGLSASRLKLEMTETILLSRNKENLAALHELRKLGVNLVLDDFGTGYSSLSQLDTFRFDVIKIDQSFLQKIRSRKDGNPILGAIIGMAAAMDTAVTVEGVETSAQFDYVRRLGCGYAQGFLLGKPADEASIRTALHAQATSSIESGA